MTRMGSEVMSRIKRSLRGVADSLEKEAIIFIDSKGRHWLNEIAREFVTKEEIPHHDFIEWLKIGSTHLQKLSYCDIHVYMMRLPGNDVIVFLRRECAEPGTKKFDLTQKEKEVLGLLVKGLSNREIANLVRVSPGTVNSHLDNIYRKLGCSNRLGASLKALKHGLFLPARGGASKKSTSAH
jgi:DNA-binding CsgD family transcriptional regulator